MTDIRNKLWERLKKDTVMENPLKCPICSECRYLKIEGVKFEQGTKLVGIKVPILYCNNCKSKDFFETPEYYNKIAEDEFLKMKENDIVEIGLKEDALVNDKFKKFKHLDFKYSYWDFMYIPGLLSDDGYLTPVFFDKDILLYYNYHKDYRVILNSFSSGNIYYKDNPLISYGFGINRNGNIFFWLGDLAKAFESEEMKPHLKRFQASNIESDHDVFSKFYQSQLPSTFDDMFPDSDNETKVFSLFYELINEIEKQINLKISQVDIWDLFDDYKPPILNEKEQIFNAYNSLNKYLVENFQVKLLKKEIEKLNGNEKLDSEKYNIPQNAELPAQSEYNRSEIKKRIKLLNKLIGDYNELGSLKSFEIFLEKKYDIKNINSLISPLYVLNDLRQLQGHLMNNSFTEKYESCKKRLSLSANSSDFEVYKKLIEELITFYKTIKDNIAIL